MSKKRGIDQYFGVEVKTKRSKTAETKEQKEEKKVPGGNVHSTNVRLSFQQYDRIATKLLEPHENDNLSALAILAKFKRMDPDELKKQLREKKWIMPTVVDLRGHRDDPFYYDVYVGRAQTQGRWEFHHDSKFANPIRLKWKKPNGEGVTLAEVLKMYKRHLKRRPELLDLLSSLNGKRIGCWCNSARECHGGVIVELFRELFVPE